MQIFIKDFGNGNMTEKRYSKFLINELPDLLDDVTINNLANTWNLPNGGPAHIHRRVREFLNKQFDNDWIGRNGPHPWPT